MRTDERILKNARIVTRDQVFLGTVVVRDGQIADMDASPCRLPQAEDLTGDYLLPGLVELHTDNLEKYMTPRPGVDWPSRSAAITHDAQIAASGITTVFDAISIGEIDPKTQRREKLSVMLDAIEHIASQGDSRADHRLHLRCEVGHPQTLGLFNRLVERPMVGLISLMDHAPGQRQFVKLEKYREYYQGKYGLNDEEMEAVIVRQTACSQQFSEPTRKAIARTCHELGLSMASHDDATEAHVQEAVGFGMRIAEFPTTIEAAVSSHGHGMKVLMGAPNVVRGKSHSGNVAATELTRHGVLDILSSDYYPASLLHAAFLLAGQSRRLPDGDPAKRYDLPGAVATASLHPARAAGLVDRGEIRIGQRADLLHVHAKRFDEPVVRQVWRYGRRVF